MRTDAIRYLVITPTNEVHIKVGVLTNDLLRKELDAERWHQFVLPDGNVALEATETPGDDQNPLASRWLGEDVFGPVVVAGGAVDTEGNLGSAPFDLCWAIMRYQEEVS